MSINGSVRISTAISSDKKIFKVTIPATHYVFHKSHIALLKNKAAKYDALMNEISRSKYNGSKIGDSMLGMAASVIPQCGYSGLSTAIPFVVGSVFANAGININQEKLIDSQPNRNKIHDFVTENAISTVLLTEDSISKNPHVFISADKGNKKGNKNLAKYICRF